MKKLLYLFLILPLVFSSCKKEEVEGCTDSAATNFDADADITDGSCIYSPVGTWNMTSFEMFMENVWIDGFNVGLDPHFTNGSLNVNANTAYTLTISNSWNYTETVTGTWSHNSNTFVMNDSDSDDIQSFTIDELDGSKFEISGSMEIDDGLFTNVKIKFNK